MDSGNEGSMPAALDPAITEKVRAFWAAEAHPVDGKVLSTRDLYRLYQQRVNNHDVHWAKFAQIVAEAKKNLKKPFPLSEWKPWENFGESAEDKAFLITMEAVCQAIQSRHLQDHESVWGIRLRVVLKGLMPYDQFAFITLYALRQLVGFHLQREPHTADLDIILAYKPWPWFPENAHAYAMATVDSIAPRPRMYSRAEYPWPPGNIEDLSIQKSVENFYAGHAWETLKVDLRLPWHYRTRPDLSESSSKPFANFGLYPNQDRALEFWMGDNPLFEKPADHGVYGLTEPMSLDDEITNDYQDPEEAP